MSAGLRRFGSLLGVWLRIDFRSRNPLGPRRMRSSRAFLFSLVFYFFAGAVLAAGTADGLPPQLRIAALLGVAATYVAFNILIEYQQIVLAPADADILYWRPISSRMLFAARAAHVLVYVGILSAALLAVPAVVVGLDATRAFLPTWLAFCAAGMLNAAAATSITILAYVLVLRFVPWERFQDALAVLQVGMSAVILLGYQALGPALQRVRLDPAAPLPAWLAVLPASWFAALPAAVGWGAGPSTWRDLGLGVGLLALCAGFGLRVLAPAYVVRMAVASTTPAPAIGAEDRRRGLSLQRLFAACVVRHPLRRAGFDFFLANLRGDGRVKAALLPIVAMPIALVLFALAEGAAPDPYAAGPAPHPAAATALPESGSGIAPAPAGHGAARTGVPIYAAAYMLALFALALSRALQSSPSWRAAWVFFVAPVQRFDLFYSGLMWGVAFGLVLPAVTLLALVLLVTWHDPYHVLAHLALPAGLAFVALPVMLRLDAHVPFAREPVRHERSRDFLLGFLVLAPVGLVAAAHHALRHHPGMCVALGGVLGVLGVLCWLGVGRRFRALPHTQAFDG